MDLPANLALPTSLGPVPVAGRLSGDAARPLVFAIGGFMPRPDALAWMAHDLPDLDVLTVNLPGMLSPRLEPSGVEPAARAFGEVLQRLAPGRRIVHVGLSTGALVALHMRPRSLVLVEPFFRPLDLWALVELYGILIPPTDAPLRQLADDYLGLYSGGRDYTELLEAAPAATTVLVGGVPLEPRREVTGLPSLTSEPERAAWRARGAALRICQGVGHNLPDKAREALAAAIREHAAAV
jgi:pimeloyl-ACP methyl ester carboxylesterase